MSLEIEHGDKPDDFELEVLRGPRKEFEDQVTEHLKDHFDDYTIKRIACSRCNSELLWSLT